MITIDLNLELSHLAGDIIEKIVILADDHQTDRQDLVLYFLSTLLIFCENKDFSNYLTEQQNSHIYS